MLRQALPGLYRSCKTRINWLLDRVIELANRMSLEAYRLPWPAAQWLAEQVADYMGDVALLLSAFPRLPAYELVGSEWRIVYVGQKDGLQAMGELFCEGEAEHRSLGRVALWKLCARTRHWLADGADLVVCQLSRLYPRRPQAPITFTVESWVRQALTIPASMDSLVSGKKRRNLRNRINRARNAGFHYRFSRSEADFDDFYHNMYAPFITARHDSSGVASQDSVRRRWLAKGGLVLVCRDDEPVAGTLCYLANDRCVDVIGGVRDADDGLLQQGVNILIDWYAMRWAQKQGARVFDLGPSQAWRSDGVFVYKRRWGARVVRLGIAGEIWTFLASRLSPKLRDRINQIGLISRVQGKHYGLLLAGPTPTTADALDEELACTAQEGLDGLVVVVPNRSPIVYDGACAE